MALLEQISFDDLTYIINRIDRHANTVLLLILRSVFQGIIPHAFSTRRMEDEFVKLQRAISLMLLHRRANKIPGRQNAEISHEYIQIWCDTYDTLRTIDPDFSEFVEYVRSTGLDSETIDRFVQKPVGADIVDAEIPCAICQEVPALGTTVTELDCKHWFHGECVVPWLWRSMTCPMCRRKVKRTNHNILQGIRIRIPRDMILYRIL